MALFSLHNDKIGKIVTCLIAVAIWIFYGNHTEKWDLTLLHSERPNLYTVLAFLSAIGLNSL